MADDELNRVMSALQRQLADATAATRQHFDDAANRLVDESRRHFDVAIETVRHEVRLIADAVAHLDEKADRHVARLEEEIDRGFAETQAMIKFSHAELERRVRMLEQGFSDLQARIERLENTTH